MTDLTRRGAMMMVGGAPAALPQIRERLASIFEPPAKILPSEWAAQNLIVPDGDYAGQLIDLDMTPYLREIMDFWCDDCTENKVSVRKCVQAGFSLMAQACVGFSIACEPCRIMIVQPTDGFLSEFNRDKFQPMLDMTPALASRVLRQASRSTMGSTIYSKRFVGGSVTLAIATSSSDLRGKTIKKVIKDEASGYPLDLDGQGSPHAMIAGRYESFLAGGEWKELSISTPTIKGECYIDQQFEAGDQRFWNVRCPGCDEEFVFKYGEEFRHNNEYPYEAHYVTACCGTVIDAIEKNILVRKGRWIATASGPGKHRSYHFDSLSSPFVPWDAIAERALTEAKIDPKSFDNLTLAKAYEIRGDAPDHVRLMALRENYDRGRIPRDGLLVTAAADVQANAIYLLIVAWAPDGSSWIVDAPVLEGDTSEPDGGAFKKLTEYYSKKFPDSFGGTRSIDAFGVDSGFRSNTVYCWTRGRPNTFALDGRDGWSRAALSQPSLVDIDISGKKIKQGATIWPVGTTPIKAWFYAKLRQRRKAEGAPEEPEGTCHHGKFLDEHFFLQITSEYLAEEKFRGRMRKAWRPKTAHTPNHFLDCMVYAAALFDYLGGNRMTPAEWERLRQMRSGDDAPKEQTPQRVERKVMRSSYMD